MGDVGVLDRTALPAPATRRSRSPELAALLAVLVAVAALMALARGPAGPPGGTEAALWQRTQAPVLVADQRWERRAVQEPNVWFADGRWHMIYTGGWDVAALGYATAASPEGPWRKHGVILGLGHGGWPGIAAHSAVYREHGRIWVYFSPGIGHGPRYGGLMVATGSDPLHLRTLEQPAVGADRTAREIVNSSIVKDGDRYRMLVESRVRGDATWRTGYAEGDSPEHFTIRRFPLPSLDRGGMYGGVQVERVPGGWALWFHASRTGGTLPTDIYRATSTDMLHWTATSSPVIARRADWEYDQVADPSIVRRGGATHLFYDGLNNPQRRAAIGYARADLTVPGLLAAGHSRWEWLPYR